MLAHGVLAFAEGGSSIINPDGSLVLILLLFLLFVFVMNRLLFRPVSRILDQRQTLTVGAANDARAAARRYEMKLNEYETTIRRNAPPLPFPFQFIIHHSSFIISD